MEWPGFSCVSEFCGMMQNKINHNATLLDVQEKN